jgi:hypothetical protein
MIKDAHKFRRFELDKNYIKDFKVLNLMAAATGGEYFL